VSFTNWLVDVSESERSIDIAPHVFGICCVCAGHVFTTYATKEIFQI